LIQAYRSYLAKIKTIRLTATTMGGAAEREELIKLGGDDKRPGQYLLALDLRNGSERLWKRVQTYEKVGAEGGLSEVVTEIFASPHRYLRVSRDRRGLHVSSRLTWGREDWERELGSTVIREAIGRVPAGTWESSVLGLLELMDVSASSTELDGRTCLLLSGQAPTMVLSVWLDAELDYMAVQITFRRIPGGESPTKPDEFLWKVTESRKVNGVPFPTKWSRRLVTPAGVITRKLPPGAPKVTIRRPRFVYLHREDVKSITLNEDLGPEAFKIRIPVPDGTRVRMNDAYQLRYEWRGGKVVKASSSLRKAWSLSERMPRANAPAPRWRLVLALITIALVACCCLLLLRRRIRER
jgi:hypothetical protein